MSLRLKQMKRLIFLSLFTFVLVLFLMLNLMMVQLNSSNKGHETSVIFPKEGELGEHARSNIYKAQIQRKPKKANLDETENHENIHPNYENLLDNLKFKPNWMENVRDKYEVLRENIKLLSDKTIPNKINAYVPNDEKTVKEEQNNERIEEMENIDEQYQNDDDYSDEDDDKNNDEYEYDDETEQNNDHISEEKIDAQYNSYLKTNPVFKPGDFGDIRGLEFYRKPKLKVEEVQLQVNEELRPKPTENPVLVEDSIYWSSYVESQVPKGLSYASVMELIRKVRSTTVHSLEPATWDRCGRAKNGFVILVNNSYLCARYRHPHMSLVFGEALSFYLSRFLGMDNVPAVILSTSNSTSQQWRAAKFAALDWENDIVIALIQWIEGLNSGSSSKAVMPDLILKAYKTGKPIKEEDIYKSVNQSGSTTHIPEIVQWGTMFVFDYLTGNYDRVASMQDSAEQENKPSIIEEPIRNLRKSAKNGKLWLVDNESGLFDAYELLKDTRGDYSTSRFSVFHRQTLQTMCVFQSQVIRALKQLNQTALPHERLVNFATSLEPLMAKLPRNDRFYRHFIQLFPRRVKEVLDWVEKCQSFSYENR